MFRTEIHIPPNTDKISLNKPLLTLGSCFADIIGQKLEDHKFEIIANPFGTIYNPVSIFSLLRLSVLNQKPAADTFLVQNGVHKNYLFHSEISALTEPELQNIIKSRIEKVHQLIPRLEWMMVTLGTAFSYLHHELDLLVANCHKVPSSFFKKELLDVEQIVESFGGIYQLIHKVNPNLKWILTVSPVRHIRDGLVQNSLSKSILRVAIDKIVRKYPTCTYFPSYELIIDDLRDYRFYSQDMIHTNSTAEEYVWEQFCSCFMDQETIGFIKAWDEILKAKNHRPFHPGSAQHQQFLRKTIEKLNGLSKITNVSNEIDHFKKRLT